MSVSVNLAARAGRAPAARRGSSTSVQKALNEETAMPPRFLFDLSNIDLNRTIVGPEGIRAVNPHRDAFELLQGIVHVEPETHSLIGYRDIRDDEFWVSGHIPGRPLFPGVLMIELAAQVASFYTKTVVGWKGFVGFGGVDNCKFRQQVMPGQRLYILCQKAWERHRRIGCQVQGMVNGTLVFEAEIVGAEF
jgi:3-hydroxyacyl-[acyl-carrier-protein] dehydratase